MSKLSHLDDEGRASMVDVSAKGETERTASAEAIIVLSQEAFDLVASGTAKKGDVLATARIAGIMAAKKTSDLIPLCHPLALSHASVTFTPDADRHAFAIVATAKTTGPTGVEMEALTAASLAALTIYDMVKAVDRGAVIESVRLLSKAGGKSGVYDAEAKAAPVRRSIPAPSSIARRSKAAPRALDHDEASGPRIVANPNGEREALRSFMISNRLQASVWAKSAGVPLNELYGFLNGRSRALAQESEEKLAKAARARVDDLFGRRK